MADRQPRGVEAAAIAETGPFHRCCSVAHVLRYGISLASARDASRMRIPCTQRATFGEMLERQRALDLTKAKAVSQSHLAGLSPAPGWPDQPVPRGSILKHLHERRVCR